MDTILISYTLKWRIRFAHNYQWTKCGKLINCQTGRLIKKTVNSGSIGYWIKGKWHNLESLKKEVELIPKVKTPF